MTILSPLQLSSVLQVVREYADADVKKRISSTNIYQGDITYPLEFRAAFEEFADLAHVAADMSTHEAIGKRLADIDPECATVVKLAYVERFVHGLKHHLEDRVSDRWSAQVRAQDECRPEVV